MLRDLTHTTDEKVLDLRENWPSAVALAGAYLHAERSLPHEGDATEALIRCRPGRASQAV
jgi:hypothetical protein